MSKGNENTELIGILEEKKELLASIFKIAKKQEILIMDDDVEALFNAIQLRQNLTNEISVLDIILEKNKKTYDYFYETANVKEMIEKIKELLQKIVGEDEENCLEAERKVILYRQHIRNLKQNKSRLVSYKNPNTLSDGIYIDAKK